MRNNHDVGGEALILWVLAAAILVLAASSCSNDASVGAPTSNPTTAASGEPSPVTSPTPSPASEAKEVGIFSEVGGWIAYSQGGLFHRPEGIFAVDPAEPGDPSEQIRLSQDAGTPVAWSPDGSNLLILRWIPGSEPQGPPETDLFILHADGTETRLTHAHGWVTGGSFSADGTQVVYAVFSNTVPSSIHVVDADGGTPQELLTAGRRYFPNLGRSFRTELYYPTFSPDGTQIAYFDGLGDHGHSLWVMNADGADPHVLLDDPMFQRARHIGSLVWSPDGTRLAFDTQGIYTVRADGSGLKLVIPRSKDPHWSPDGSRISYSSRRSLEIAAAGGTQVVEFGYAGSGPWNPLV